MPPTHTRPVRVRESRGVEESGSRGVARWASSIPAPAEPNVCSNARVPQTRSRGAECSAGSDSPKPYCKHTAPPGQGNVGSRLYKHAAPLGQRNVRENKHESTRDSGETEVCPSGAGFKT